MERSGAISFPFEVFEGERPDFFIRHGKEQFGIEVTEAADPDEQAKWTKEAKDDRASAEPVPRLVGEEACHNPEKVRDIVGKAVSRKAGRANYTPCDLLVYLNTHADWFLEGEELFDLLSEIELETCPFPRVYVYKPDTLLELVSETIHA
ncbi:hypothetical protein CLV78_10337 [Aliiruegeria haliotis]|uniref:Uncharacterized protein n=1 Tax=Aliiruegeria haliotis TaxID=1280846 RepID=A0A2T0RSV9_9RHOB|nr:hypothetical protein [Aliiruegeria haliotis]PRY24173.1 hypothetical protein CLV78_10337 [Aliiruegeria haliotis]